ncbi:MAG: hypothetical protein ACRD98_07580 [Nitrososphaera sp.]
MLQDAIPVVMIQKVAERAGAKYHCNLRKNFDVNHFGWKLAHIEPVGLNSREDLTKVPIDRLASQFVKLVSPENMFVVPMAWAGIAEIDAVIRAVSSARR